MDTEMDVVREHVEAAEAAAGEQDNEPAADVAGELDRDEYLDDEFDDEFFDEDDEYEQYETDAAELRRFVEDTVLEELGPLRAELADLADMRQERTTGQTRQQAEAYQAFHRSADEAARALGMPHADREAIVQGMFHVIALAEESGAWEGLDVSYDEFRRMAANVAAEMYRNDSIRERALKRA
ncbi:MAG: hypothetical protein ACRDOP_01145 [Gaiellaceae bacterium]